jgi:hypothetical protein
MSAASNELDQGSDVDEPMASQSKVWLMDLWVIDILQIANFIIKAWWVKIKKHSFALITA